MNLVFEGKPKRFVFVERGNVSHPERKDSRAFLANLFVSSHHHLDQNTHTTYPWHHPQNGQDREGFSPSQVGFGKAIGSTIRISQVSLSTRFMFRLSSIDPVGLVWNVQPLSTLPWVPSLGFDVTILLKQTFLLQREVTSMNRFVIRPL